MHENVYKELYPKAGEQIRKDEEIRYTVSLTDEELARLEMLLTLDASEDATDSTVCSQLDVCRDDIHSILVQAVDNGWSSPNVDTEDDE